MPSSTIFSAGQWENPSGRLTRQPPSVGACGQRQKTRDDKRVQLDADHKARFLSHLTAFGSSATCSVPDALIQWLGSWTPSEHGRFKWPREGKRTKMCMCTCLDCETFSESAWNNSRSLMERSTEDCLNCFYTRCRYEVLARASSSATSTLRANRASLQGDILRPQALQLPARGQQPKAAQGSSRQLKATPFSTPKDPKTPNACITMHPIWSGCSKAMVHDVNDLASLEELLSQCAAEPRLLPIHYMVIRCRAHMEHIHMSHASDRQPQEKLHKHVCGLGKGEVRDCLLQKDIQAHDGGDQPARQWSCLRTS